MRTTACQFATDAILSGMVFLSETVVNNSVI